MNTKKIPKIAFIDIDGTITSYLSDSKLTSENIDAINWFTKNKCHLVLTTGRNITQAKKVILQLRKSEYVRYIISNNGAEIYDLIEDKYIQNICLPIDKVINVAKYALKNNLFFKTSLSPIIFHNKKINFLVKKIWTIASKDNFRWIEDFFNFINDDSNKDKCIQKVSLINFKLSKSKSQDIIETIRSNFPDFTITIGANGRLAEMVSKGVNKGAAANKLAILLDANIKEDCIAVGNGDNDYDLFKMVTKSFAINGSPQYLSEIAAHRLISKERDNAMQEVKKIIKEWELKPKSQE